MTPDYLVLGGLFQGIGLKGYAVRLSRSVAKPRARTTSRGGTLKLFQFMRLSAGERLGPYEITAKIGAGGMGEIYRARDVRLSRGVAIKVSTECFSDRFEREARSIAALNHPNICTLHDVGPNYLVMELVE